MNWFTKRKSRKWQEDRKLWKLYSGKRVMNKLKGIILGFKHHMESIEKEKRRQFEQIMRKERPESEK